MTYVSPFNWFQSWATGGATTKGDEGPGRKQETLAFQRQDGWFDQIFTGNND